MRSLFDKDNYNCGVEGIEETCEPYNLEDQIVEYDDCTVDAMDKFINAQIQMAHNNFNQCEILKSRKRDVLCNTVGRYYSNIFLDMRQYEFEFPDGVVKSYTSNIIVDSLYLQVDS